MYALNAQEAMKGDERSSRIDELGKYIGVFTRVEDLTSAKGARGVDFAFVAESGAMGNFTVWTVGRDGKTLRGAQLIQAIMACLRVKNIAPQAVVVKKYDRDQGKVVEVSAPCFADLMNKRIGVCIETADYQKTNGGIGAKLELAAAFDAETELMASEILSRKTTPTMLARVVTTLRHRPLKNSGGNSNSSHPNAPGNNAGSAADMDDDIPF